MKISNSIALVTGASSGIGRAIALAFDKAGARVAIAARRGKMLEEMARSMNDPLVLPVDLSDENQTREMIEKTVSHYGGIDVLVNNAASIIVSRSDEIKAEDLLRAYKTNLIGPVIATNEAVRHMRKQGRGHIINIGSPGFMIGIPLYGPYVCSKAAMSAWTRTIQAEWQDTNITVSEYFPGYIKTDSPAESSYGPVEQDLVIDPDQNFLTKYFTRPKTPEHVARQVLRLVEKPRLLVYSSPTGGIGSWLANIPKLRCSIAAGMARNARKKLRLSVFSEK